MRVNGLPIPQGSKTAGKTASGRLFVRDANPGLKAWREAVAQASWNVMQEREFPMNAIAAPCEVTATFYFEKPASNRAKYPTSLRIGDVDKLLRGLLDGCVDGGLLEDDRFVVFASAGKLWCDDITDTPGVFVIVRTIEDDTPWTVR